MKKHCNSLGIAFTLLTAIMATMLCISCQKEGNDTMVLPLYNGRISPIVIPIPEQKQLTDHGFVIHEGIEPPDIQGVYLAAPLVNQYASDDYRNDFYDLLMTFNHQYKRGMVEYTENQRDTVNGASINAQIIGHDSCFTMYCTQYISEYTGNTLLFNCKIATVISGIHTEKGIKDLQYAYIMQEKEQPNPNYFPLAPVNTVRIYKDNDNLASKIRNVK